MSLGLRIRQLRQSHGLTQSQLGGPDLSKSFISLLEKDRARPSLRTLQLLARRLSTSVDSLLGQDGHIPEMVCEGLLTLSSAAIQARDLDRADRLLESASLLASTYHVEEARREVALQVARVSVERRAFAAAWVKLVEVRRENQQARDLWRLGRALLEMGVVKVRERNFSDAVPLLEEALTVFRRARAGRDPHFARALITLGTAWANLGELTRAVRLFEKASRSEVADRTPTLKGRALWGLGQAYRKMGRLALARSILEEAKDAFERAEELEDYIKVSKALAQILFQEGQAKAALRHLLHALRASERLGMTVMHASTLTEIGRVHIAMRRVEEAADFARQALEAAQANGDPVEVAEATAILARVHLERGEIATATRLYKEALHAFKQRKMKVKMAEVARELGLLLRERGAHAQAATYLAMALKEESKEVSAAPE